MKCMDLYKWCYSKGLKKKMTSQREGHRRITLDFILFIFTILLLFDVINQVNIF